MNCHVSDHDFVFCSITNNDLQSIPTVRTYRSFKNISSIDFQSDLQRIDFDHMLRLNTIEDKVHFFNSSILDLFHKHAPLIARTSTKKPIPWLTDNLKMMMKMRDEAKSLFRRTQRRGDWEYYKSLRNLTNKTFKLEKRAYFDYISHTRDRRLLWKQLNVLGVKRQDEINIPQNLKDPNVVNSFFINSVPNINSGSSSKGAMLPFYYNVSEKLSFTLVRIETIAEIIGNMKSTASGSDQINITMLRLCSPFIMPYITHIINSCILDSVFPQCWKNAVVVPLPKTRKVQQLKDLRPISLLPCLSKILERVLHTQIKAHINKYNLLPVVQSGFRSGYSCTTALLHVTDDILSATDQGLMTVVVLLDFSKAFDTVNHSTLLTVLSGMGFDRDAMSLIADFLSRRTQYVSIDCKNSLPSEVVRGVPQGSILSPILFSLYTSSFVNNLKYTKAHLYADDIQIYCSFKMSEWEESIAKINADLDTLYHTSFTYSLHLNPDKSQVLVFGGKETCRTLSNVIDIRINNLHVPVVNKDRSLSFPVQLLF